MNARTPKDDPQAVFVHVGVTGSRYPLPAAQKEALRDNLCALDHAHDGRVIVHHGCCTGADEEAHRVARKLAWLIEGHPGHGTDGRSPWLMPRELLAELDAMHKSRRYYLRNRDIAAACSILVAAPAYPEADPRSARSGTWQTVRDARSRDRSIACVWPDGSGHLITGGAS